VGRMDQQGLRGEIDGFSCPGDVKVLGDNLRITAAYARPERSLARILRPLFDCQHSEGSFQRSPGRQGGFR
jgi:hypothetical protein